MYVKCKFYRPSADELNSTSFNQVREVISYNILFGSFK